MYLDYHILTEALDTEDDEEIFTEEPKELKVGDRVIVVDEESDLLGLSGIVEFIDGEDVTVLLNWDDEHQLRQTFNIDELSQEVDDDIEESLTESASLKEVFSKDIPQWVIDGLKQNPEILDDFASEGVDLANDKFIEVQPTDIPSKDLYSSNSTELYHTAGHTFALPVFLLLMPKQKKPTFYIPRWINIRRKFKSELSNTYKYIRNFPPEELKKYIIRAGYFALDGDVERKQMDRVKAKDDLADLDTYRYSEDDVEYQYFPSRFDKSGYHKHSQADLITTLNPVTRKNYRVRLERIEKYFTELETDIEKVSKKIKDKYEVSSPEAKEAEEIIKEMKDDREYILKLLDEQTDKSKFSVRYNNLIAYAYKYYHNIKEALRELNKKLDDAQ